MPTPKTPQKKPIKKLPTTITVTLTYHEALSIVSATLLHVIEQRSEGDHYNKQGYKGIAFRKYADTELLMHAREKIRRLL